MFISLQKDNELIEITDEENIKTKLWQRVKMRAQLFRKIQLKEETRQLKLRMSISVLGISQAKRCKKCLIKF